MAATIITTDELREFKLELLEAFKELLAQQGDVQQKRWMKSKEVRDLLGISPGTLQNLRVNGTLPFSKVGGVLYYQYQDVMQVLEQNRVDQYLVCKR
ncbi:Helix-turn-helix domain-containing protein [Pustulibacterium marinum]|uniref:Helix-turn-helix domain-containing protein n=1 Tax=Pustulibacterium marinum TaxID=1224947 RepID=A0A1I7IYM6_9FLAO|nr:helix-turn-helix domain-containing protein [Pustulibacterium marinum]SFU78038.1 Helix-turn-helix domain-containing protein [Pustulibacterium marinum]